MARTKNKRPEKSLAHDRILELETAITEVRNGRRTSPRTARLLAAGLPRMAQKLAEDATEAVIEAVRGERSAVINDRTRGRMHRLAGVAKLGADCSASSGRTPQRLP